MTPSAAVSQSALSCDLSERRALRPARLPPTKLSPRTSTVGTPRRDSVPGPPGNRGGNPCHRTNRWCRHARATASRSSCRPPCRKQDRSRWPLLRPPRCTPWEYTGGVSALARGVQSADGRTGCQRSAYGPRSRAATLGGRAWRGDHRPWPDDVWVTGRRCEPGLRPAARPCPSRSSDPVARARRRGPRPARHRDLRDVPSVWASDRPRSSRCPPAGRPLHRMPGRRGPTSPMIDSARR